MHFEEVGLSRQEEVLLDRVTHIKVGGVRGRGGPPRNPLEVLPGFLQFCETWKAGEVAKKAFPLEGLKLNLPREVGQETGIGDEQKGGEHGEG